MAFSESGLIVERIDGNISPLSCDRSQTSRRTARACRDSGTSWGRRIFMRSVGIVHELFCHTISERLMNRTSPGRVMVKATNWMAARSVGQPSYSSIEVIKAPSCHSSVIAGR
jgi:hypothetical protein